MKPESSYNRLISVEAYSGSQASEFCGAAPIIKSSSSDLIERKSGADLDFG
jgi:hypothetical protein